MFKSKVKGEHAYSAEPKASCQMNKRFILFGWLTRHRDVCKSRSFLQMAKERRFEEICNVLQQQKEKNWLNAWEDSREPAYESLHALCMYRPTATVVQAVIDTLQATVCRNVDATMLVDAHGRTPLHIAAASGCSSAVIELLMRKNTAILTLDNGGRYPLHWACTFNPGRGGLKREDDRVEVIKKMIEAYPVSVLTKDKKGNTPANLATANEADKRILAALHFVARILPVNVAKDPASSITETTCEIPQEALCSYDDCDDDLSSIGSKGVTSHKRCYLNSEQKSPNLIFL